MSKVEGRAAAFAQNTEGKTSTFLPTGLLLTGFVAVFTGQRILLEGSSHRIATYGGLLVLALAFGLRLRAFASARGDVRAVEGRLLGAYAGVGIALVLYALSTDWATAKLGLAEKAAERSSGALTGLWLALLLVSVAGLLFAELAYARMPIPAAVELRRVRTAIQAGVSLALSIVFVVSINYVATARDVRKDVSYFRTTEPSAGTRRQIEKLDQNVRVVLFYEPANDVLAQLLPYFAALKSANGRFAYEVQDVALAPKLATKYKIRDNGNVLLIRGTGDAEKGESFRIGTELTEARANLRKLDGAFQTAFNKLVRPERTLYLTVGHGERNAKSSEQAKEDRTEVLEDVLLRLHLKAQNLGLAQGLGHGEIPAAANAVLVMGASQPFLPEEVETLLKYVRGGGRLLVMLDPDVKSGLEPLLQGLGLELLPGTVTSDTNFMVHSYNPSDHAIVYTSNYTSHPSVTTVTRHQRELASVFVKAAALKAASAPVEPKPSVTFPVQSTRVFWRDLDGDFTRDPEEPAETLKLMAAVTLPGTKKDQEGRAVVLGDSDFMTDKVAPNNGNYLLFIDALAWLVGNEELSAEVSSEEDVPIEHSRQQDKVWFYVTTFAVPVPIVALGLWVSRRRRRRAEVKS